MIKAILFDMDGVLIDAKDWHYEALNSALGLFGYKISRESHLSTFDGLPTKRKLEMLTKSQGLPPGLHGFINDLKQAYTLEITNSKCKPTFNHRFAMRQLKEQGYKIAVCSNSIKMSIETMMRLSGLSPYIDLILSNEDVGFGKPSPEIYLKAMSEFHLSPNECLILEDNDHGIQAAISSGGYLLKVATPNDVTHRAIMEQISLISNKERGL